MKKLFSTLLAAAMVLSLLTVGERTALADAPATIPEGKVFAGYYTDDTYITPSEQETAYPKFVSSDVLQVKYQLTYLANEDQPSTRLRVVTTVDSTHYKRVGFLLSVDGGAEREFATKKVAKKITGTTDLGALEYVPADFNEASMYFCAYNFTVKQESYGKTFTFTPFWETMDGTIVKGENGTYIDGEYGRPIKISESPAFNNYLIPDADGLCAFAAESQTRNFDGWTVKLTDDIDLNPDWSASADGMTGGEGTPAAWTPIGTNALPFAGTFDGQGHTISGLYLSASASNQGMFAKTGADAVIKDFYLKNSYLTVSGKSNTSFGSIAGVADGGTFEKIYSNAFVMGGCNRVGGLIGVAQNNPITMRECAFAGSARLTDQASYLGGLIGQTQAGGNIENCMNIGEVYHTFSGSLSTAAVGGLVGCVQTAELQIADSVNHSDAQYTSGNYIGLIVGLNQSTVTMTNCHSILYTYATGANKNLIGNPAVNPSGCTRQNKADVAGDKSRTVANVSNLFTSESAKGYWVCSADSLPVLSCFADEYAGGTVDTSWYNESDTEFVLTDAADLYGFAQLSKTNSFAGKTVKLGADIDLNPGCVADSTGMTGSPVLWTPIGDTSTYRFAGTFDGQGHTISGLFLDATATYQGMFQGTASAAVVRNFKLKNSFLRSTAHYLGSIAGNGMGTFEKIYSEAVVYANGGAYIGGMIGNTSTGGGITMSDCWFAGSATINTRQNYLGGLVGRIDYDSSIKNCIVTGEVYNHATGLTNCGTACFVGQLVSGKSLTISSSVNFSRPKADTSGCTTLGYFVGANSGTLTLQKSHTIAESDRYLVNSGNPADSTYLNNGCTRQDASNVAGVKAYSVSGVKDLFTDEESAGHWVCSADSLPVLSCFADEYAAGTLDIDTDWYGDGTADTFTLTDAADLYGFARLSQTNDFAGKTVKLGADIVVNSNMSAPAFEWIPIGSSSALFAGTFDGQGHTISGLYIKRTGAQVCGLFAEVGSAAIRNFRLTDSSFSFTGHAMAYMGAVAGRTRGTAVLENIYVDAAISTTGKSAGLVGVGQSGTLTITNCWNAGNITGTAPAVSGVAELGGIVGYFGGSTLNLTACLNTGTITSTLSASAEQETGSSGIGGLVGHTSGSAVFNMSYCLNAGNIIIEDGIEYYGSMAGNINASSAHFVQSAALIVFGEDGHEYNGTGNTANVKTRSLEILKGTGIAEELPDFFMQTDGSGVPYWSPVDDDVPVLTSFADVQKKNKLTYYVDGAAAGFAASAADISQLSSLYSGRSLYQGEIHNHADTSVGSDLGTSDGYIELDQWYPQMTALGLDFAASLDHRQASHIDLAVWDESRLLYGTEVGAWIPNVSSGYGKLPVGSTGPVDDYSGATWNQHHYNMLFRTKAQLEAVLNAFPQFRYKQSTNGNVSWPNRTNCGQMEFDGWNPSTRDQFAELIRTVQSNGGFFVLPHTSSTNQYNSGQAVDYDFGVDGVGFEVMYLDHSSDDILYSRWRQLLAGGAKMYACAGDDSHRDLGTSTLTSVYGTSAAASDKGYLIDQLRAGDFVAGSAGIRMSVGSTAMGGSCSFSGKRVVVDVEKIHAIANDLSHDYRLYVFSDEGPVCCRKLAVNASTGAVDGVELAFDADSSCAFYRVEVRDNTSGKRIAIGTPIWNAD